MPPPALFSSTMQAAALSATSNILAQLLTNYQSNQNPTSKTAGASSAGGGGGWNIQTTPVIHFILFTLLTCPPNILWQEFLEYAFPGRPSPEEYHHVRNIKGAGVREGKEEGKLNIKNTLIKLLLDQTLAATINTLAFIAIMTSLRVGASGVPVGPLVLEAIRNDFWPIMKAGAKLWPLVSLGNFLFVPVDKRVVVAGVFGVAWGVWLSLVAAGK